MWASISWSRHEHTHTHTHLESKTKQQELTNRRKETKYSRRPSYDRIREEKGERELREEQVTAQEF